MKIWFEQDSFSWGIYGSLIVERDFYNGVEVDKTTNDEKKEEQYIEWYIYSIVCEVFTEWMNIVQEDLPYDLRVWGSPTYRYSTCRHITI